MDCQRNRGVNAPPLFGFRLTERWKKRLRLFYRRSMTAVGGVALAVSVGVQAAQIGIPGVRRVAETLAFGGALAAAVTPEEQGPPLPTESKLSLFLSPPSGDMPFLEASAADLPTVDAPDDPAADMEPDMTPAPPAGVNVVARDLSPAAPFSLFNMTSTMDPDLDETYRAYLTAANARAPAAIDRSAPLVLILHTHSTEAYAPKNRGDDRSFPAGYVPRSNDPAENVIAVGSALAETLEKRGIPTIHCTFGHDLEDYSGAYDREKETILSYLEEYPSIRYIFDIHRDSIEASDGSIVKTAVTVDGEPAAQLMFVVGTNEKGANHPRWEDNLGYALALQAALAADHPGLMRAVNLRGASFNEQYTPYSLLIEVGASGNTLAEAKRSAALLGEGIADEILFGAGRVDSGN